MNSDFFRNSTPGDPPVPFLLPIAETTFGIVTDVKLLELSNVDLANEFSNMITAQRAFQASARIISTSDEMLQELVNLKR